ncbi:MAG: SDR family NAD(P)-dependent oxidoreductase, partial [Bacteroidota bacterium]
MKVQNKTIVVTGGGSGMGRELVVHLLSKDARVITIDIHEDALLETIALAGARKDALKTFVVNIADRTAVEKLLNDSIVAFGFVDGIINNASIIQPFVKVNELGY